jgi:hypothetical protein
MASSFLGGFAKSLSGSIEKNYEREQDNKQWEDRQKKMMELEKQRIASVQYAAGPNGTVMAQPVNAAGEPVGQPRPATDIEAKRFAEGETERKLKFRGLEANIEQSEASTANQNAQRENIPTENARANRAIDIQERYANNASATIDLQRQSLEQDIRRKKWETDEAMAGRPVPGRGGSSSTREDLTDEERRKYDADAIEMVQNLEPPMTAEEAAAFQTARDARQRYDMVMQFRRDRVGQTTTTDTETAAPYEMNLDAMLQAMRGVKK